MTLKTEVMAAENSHLFYNITVCTLFLINTYSLGDLF